MPLSLLGHLTSESMHVHAYWQGMVGPPSCKLYNASLSVMCAGVQMLRSWGHRLAQARPLGFWATRLRLAKAMRRGSCRRMLTLRLLVSRLPTLLRRQHGLHHRLLRISCLVHIA